jgi:acyl-CoA thioesterase I
VAKTALLVALVFVLVGCSSSSRSIVALGDSVPRGTNCDCEPYPPLTATDLGHHFAATNDAVAGYTTANVLHQVESDEAVIEHLRKADVVEVEVGANDVAHTNACGAVVSCYTPKLPAMEENLTSIVERVKRLTSGHKALVVVLDYWSVWLGGTYAAAHGEAYVDAAAELTADVDAAIAAVAGRTGSAYVDLRAAFKGPDYTYDETHYLSNDGDHPNAAGHRQIAAAAEQVIRTDLGF